MENVKELTLIFMEPLRLAIEKVISRERKPICLVEIFGQRHLIHLFDTVKSRAELAIVGHGLQIA